MNERPKSADPVRQKSGILIVRRHDDAESLKASKVAGQRQRNSRTAFGVGSVGDSVLLQLRNIRDTRIFDAPKLFRIFFRIGHKRWRGIDVPSVHAVHGARRAEMRETAAVLHPAKQQGRSVGEQRCSGIKYAIDPIRPIFAGQDWISGMPMQK